MKSIDEDFNQFMKRREDAAQAYVNGHVEPLRQLCAQSLPATFFGPRGGFRQGAEQVFLTYEYDSKSFDPGGVSSFEILHKGMSGDLGYWVGFQHAKARLHGCSNIAPMTLRITEFFRREGREWKLVHRHADALATEAK